MNQAITQMDEVTQQNAALVEEAAAAAESLEEQAQNLQGAVAIFNIGGSHTVVKAASRGAKASARVEPLLRPATERRGPNRAPNVARLVSKPASAQPTAPRAKVAAAGGSSEEQWEEF